ncbi:hypothetical protein [Nocardia tenerifensis]|nr:hypothetical protein [Nocardia tenerifensis]
MHVAPTIFSQWHSGSATTDWLVGAVIVLVVDTPAGGAALLL